MCNIENFDVIESLADKYRSERSGMIWDMGCRYHTVEGYNIEILSFDFYGMIWETCRYHEII